MPPRLPEAPRWAWIAMAFSAVAIALFLPGVLDTTSSSVPVETTAPASASSPSGEPSRSGSAAEPVQVLVIGDAWTVGSETGGMGATNWTSILSQRLAADGHPAELTVAAAVGAGFVQADDRGRTFADLALSQRGAPPDIVLFFGSESDVASTRIIRSAAAETFERVRSEWPRTALVVVGPAWAGERPPPSLMTAAEGVRIAAEDAQASFVDPLAGGWFSDPAGPGVSEPGGYPTDAGHRLIAAHMERALNEVWGSSSDG